MTFDENGALLTGRDALISDTRLRLMLPRGRLSAFAPDVGSDTESLLGKSPAFALARLPKLIREALLSDERVLSVEGSNPYTVQTTLGTLTILADFESPLLLEVY